MNINDLYKQMLDTALNVVGDEAQQMSGPLQKALNAQKFLRAKSVSLNKYA